MAPVASLSIEMRAGFDKLGADLKKINRSFNSFEKDISQNFSKIGTALNLVIGGVAIAGLVKLGNEIGRLADKGEQVGSIAESFQKLGGSSTVIEDARGRIIGLVGAFDLMAIANKGLVAGIPGFQNAFANIVDLGGRLANTFGKDTKVAVEELTDAIVKGQAKALVPLGFSFTDTSNKALVTQEALAQLTKVMERFNPVGDSVSNAMTSFSITLDEAWAKMGIGINSSTELTAAIRMFEQAIKQIDLQQFGKDLADLIAKLVSLGGDVLPIVIQGFRNFKEAINWFSDAKGTTSELVQLNNQLEQLKAAQAQVQAQSPWADNSKQIEQYQRDIDITWKKIQELNKELNKPTDLGPIGPNRSLQDPKTWVREEKAKVKEVFQYREALMTKEIEEYYQRMKDSFDKIASSFGGALSKLGIDGEKLTSGLAGLFSPEEKTGFLNQISQMLGISADKFTAFAEGAAETLGAVFEAGAINKKTSSEAGTGGAVGAGLGAIFGGPEGAKIGNVLGSMIGGMFKWGAKNPQTLARQAFEQFLEDAFKDLRVRFFGKDGKLGGMFNGNFVGKGLTTDFNGGKWTQNMAAWGDKATGTFLGLGEAMKELQGITEDVGAQIGYMLGTNLAGNIDNAKLLVMELGLSFEQVSDALLKSALKGSISWAEFNRYIGETAEAFKPGLAAVGAINEAFQNLIDGAGQGRISVKSFKDVAVEAMEAGVTSMEGLKQRLLAGGADPEYVNALFTAAAQKGIKSLKEWANASDNVAGSVVGDMEGLSAKLQETWKGMRESLKEMSDGLKEIPAKVTSNVEINVSTKYDDKTQSVIDTFGNSATPAGIPKPSTRSMTSQVHANIANGANASSNTQRAAATGNSVNIDARGAAPGVEQQIMRAAAFVEQRVMNRVYDTLQNGRQRGGRAGDTY